MKLYLLSLESWNNNEKIAVSYCVSLQSGMHSVWYMQEKFRKS